MTSARPNFGKKFDRAPQGQIEIDVDPSDRVSVSRSRDRTRILILPGEDATHGGAALHGGQSAPIYYVLGAVYYLLILLGMIARRAM